LFNACFCVLVSRKVKVDAHIWNPSTVSQPVPLPDVFLRHHDVAPTCFCQEFEQALTGIITSSRGDVVSLFEIAVGASGVFRTSIRKQQRLIPKSLCCKNWVWFRLAEAFQPVLQIAEGGVTGGFASCGFSRVYFPFRLCTGMLCGIIFWVRQQPMAGRLVHIFRAPLSFGGVRKEAWMNHTASEVKATSRVTQNFWRSYGVGGGSGVQGRTFSCCQ